MNGAAPGLSGNLRRVVPTSSAVVLSCLLGCLLPADNALANDIYETNDTLQTATDLSADLAAADGRLVVTNLSITSGDQDWYRIMVTATSCVQAWFLFSPGDDGHDLDVEIYNEATNKLLQSTSSDDDEYVSLTITNSAARYIKVFGWGGATNDYSMRIWVDPADAEIVLPDPLAIELPAEGMTNILASDSPMAGLLASVTAGSLQMTNDHADCVFPLGGTEVTWTAWDGAPEAGTMKARKSAFVWVFPHGQTPVGASRKIRATSGNQGTKVARDSAGRLHAAWFDYNTSGPGHRVMYRHGVQDQDSGAVTWTEPAVQVNDPGTANSQSQVAMAISSNYAHFAWYGGSGRSCYRRMRLSDFGFDPVRTNAITGGGSQDDNSPAIAAQDDDTIHLVSASLVYGCTTNGGASWTNQAIPKPSMAYPKGPALAVDGWGNVHVVFTRVVRTSSPQYWDLYYLRKPAGNTNWISDDGRTGTNGNVLAGLQGWRDPLAYPAEDDPSWDALADWAAIEVDDLNNIHITWHGTAGSPHLYGNDEACYLTRPCTGAGTWGAWGDVINLMPRSTYGTYSFAPSICVNAVERLAFPVYFYGYQPADVSCCQSAFRVIRNGAMEGEPVEISQSIALDINTWFPCACPRLYRHPNGRVWLDVLQTAITDAYGYSRFHGAPPYVITYQAYEVTSLIYAPMGTPISWLYDHALTNYPGGWTEAESDDRDVDGMRAWQEYVAGTDPTNPASVFAFTTLSAEAETNVVFAWNSASNRLYSVEWSTNLMENLWTAVPDLTNLAASPPLNTVTVNVESANSFYRIRSIMP